MKVRHSPAAFSLVEITLALGIAAFCLLAIFGLLPIGINSNQASIQQTTATNISSTIISDMRSVPSSAAIAASNSALNSISPKYQIDLTQTAKTIYLDEGGGLQPTATGKDSRFKAVITLASPTGNPAPRTATYGMVVISWPAPSSKPLGSVTSFVALDRN